MAMVLVLCIFNGFTDLALSQLSNIDPDIAVIPAKGKTIASADSLASAIAAVDGVGSALPTVNERALLDDGITKLPVVMKGVPAEYADASPIDDIMIAGEYALGTDDGIPAVQVSVGVGNSIGLYPSPESHLHLYVPRRVGRINPANPAASFRNGVLAFSGVFRVNSTDIDRDHVIVPLDAARALLDYDTEASAIEVRVKDGASADEVRGSLRKSLGPELKVLDRIEQRSESFSMISIEKWITFMLLVFILVIATFNVISTLSLLAIEKRDNMTTLRALGASPATIRDIFIAEGFLVTVVGGAIGIVAGIVVALVQQIFHVVRLSAGASSLTIDYYPVRLEPTDIAAVAAVIALLAVVISLVARLIVRNVAKPR